MTFAAVIVFNRFIRTCRPHPSTGHSAFYRTGTFDLLDTFFALMFPFFLSVFAIFLFRQAFKTFPDDIVLAARLDGMKGVGNPLAGRDPEHQAADRRFCRLLLCCALE